MVFDIILTKFRASCNSADEKGGNAVIRLALEEYRCLDLTRNNDFFIYFLLYKCYELENYEYLFGVLVILIFYSYMQCHLLLKRERFHTPTESLDDTGYHGRSGWNIRHLETHVSRLSE